MQNSPSHTRHFSTGQDLLRIHYNKNCMSSRYTKKKKKKKKKKKNPFDSIKQH